MRRPCVIRDTRSRLPVQSADRVGNGFLETVMHPALDVSLWSESVPDTAVMVADGQTAKVTVRHGRLLVEDGVPGNRRTREIPKVPREVTRLVILANHGYITFEALRWMRAIGIDVSHIAEDVTMTSGSGDGDWRMVGRQLSQDLTVARYLVSRKISGQADTLDLCFGANRTSPRLRALAASVDSTDKDVQYIRACEGMAAAHYWAMWKGDVKVCWSPRDLTVVPPHWRAFPGRLSLAFKWETNRNATDPVNAMLNYVYKILETETLTACRVFGLHPDLGILHAGRTDRHAFALDLMEPVRPLCDRLVLNLIRANGPGKYFDRRWCHELGEGICVLDPPLTHVLAGWSADIGTMVRGYASTVREVFRGG